MLQGKRWLLLLLAAITVALTVGILASPQYDFSARQEEHQKKFGAVYMTLNNPFYEIIDEEIRTDVENHGDVLLSRDPALSVEKQTEEVKDLIREGVSVIFLNPVDFERMGPALEAARQARVPVITIDTNVQDSDYVASTIETDNYAAGVACANHLLEMATHANILLLKHSTARSAVDRIAGFRQTLAGHPGFQIIDEAECEGQLERAMPAMQEMLARHPEADTVMALNDPSALGAMAALEACGRLQGFRVYGVDGVPETKELILAGRMTATAGQSPRRIGQLAAHQAYRLLAGEPVEQLIQLPIHLWTKENLSSAQIKEWD
ncbi:sugar ABC transporter substrate-binding protein [Mitsuokella sp.]|uniref:sugar ABC transporter substrate-binding protein n=1 Tax=Mitsuokella sp. TaxID=2049034 RepID=UPI002A7FE2E5|nr:sugar ABC transporter substrate-binding protein [Mitsuokella sp.]MDY4473716.1 sugar ABC transporter substrate-binding protein [Mitsuokella sp.]